MREQKETVARAVGAVAVVVAMVVLMVIMKLATTEVSSVHLAAFAAGDLVLMIVGAVMVFNPHAFSARRDQLAPQAPPPATDKVIDPNVTPLSLLPAGSRVARDELGMLSPDELRLMSGFTVDVRDRDKDV